MSIQTEMFIDPLYELAVGQLRNQILRGEPIVWQGCSEPGGPRVQVGGYAGNLGNLVKIPQGYLDAWTRGPDARMEFYSISAIREDLKAAGFLVQDVRP